MISYAKECLCDVITEVEPLLALHYDELTLNKEVAKLDPMWERYTAMEHAGAFHVFTVRDGGKLIGYSAFFLAPHMHYRSLIVAQNDVLFLHPEHRKGVTGVKLIRQSHDGVRALGAHKIIWHCKRSNHLKQLLLRLYPQYKEEEDMVGGLL